MKLHTITAAIAAFLSLPFVAFAQEEKHVGIAKPWQLGFQEPVTSIFERLHFTHNVILLPIITAICVVVLLLMLYIIVRFNRKANPVASKTTHNTRLEIIWTTIPILILIAIAIPSLRDHYYMHDYSAPDLTLKVVGHQWYWTYEYPDHGGFSFESNMKADKELKDDEPRLLAVDNPVVVPVNKKVRVLLTGADVIHAWAVPAFGVKRDTVPGRLNETWFRAEKEGVYYGQCSELCGVKHAFMPIEVRVVSQAEFDRWVKQKQQAAGITPVAAPEASKPATTDEVKL